ncbi:unnamed protein product [Heligmosomoides polygyrus]|uniref:Transposase n=1 Tax=Heligmosomoides polygyrus TaxID=6339 RepID=A0A183GD04_HELPZ|nr:unnamed protein product [Heligmosomoides polygyrus]
MSASAMATARDAHREPSRRCALPHHCSGWEYTIGLKPSLYLDAERRDATYCGHIDRVTRSINLATMRDVASLGVGSINGVLGTPLAGRRQR